MNFTYCNCLILKIILLIIIYLIQQFVRYIYHSIIKLSKNDLKTNVELLIAADELCLPDLFEILQEHLLRNMEEQLKQNFCLVHKISMQHQSFTILQSYCKLIVKQIPHVIFKSKDFITLEKDTLISLLKRDDLCMEEIEIWDSIIKWGFAQISSSSLPISITESKNWTKEDLKKLATILQPCVPLVKFGSIGPKDFFRSISETADAVVIDHFIQGDGTPHGTRTKHTELPEAMKRVEPKSVLLSYRDEMVAIAQEFMPGRVGVNVDGFAGTFLP